MTVLISFLLQSVAIGILILIPLAYTEALPARRFMSLLMSPPPPPAPARPVEVSRLARSAPVNIQPRREMVQPTQIPERVEIIVEEPLPPVPSMGFVGTDANGIDSFTSDLIELSSVLEPPPPPPAQEPERTRIGGDVMAARLIHQPMPIFPPLARQARIQGTVQLQALINKEGTIENLTVLSGHPMLIPAALEAVRRWRYAPTLLNGVPVEVETTIEVNFRLGG